MQKTLFITLQGKGGVSKSLTTIWLAQYFEATGHKVKGYDTDPNNATFAGYKALNVKTIDIMDEHHDIKARQFDGMIESILSDKEDVILIDNGATSFNPILSYIEDGDILSLLRDNGIRVVASVPLVGGSEYLETLKGANYIYLHTNVLMLFWLNRFFGEFPTNSNDPVKLLNKEVGKQMLGIVEIPYKKSDTFGQDLTNMHASRMTFDQCINDMKLGAVITHRIKTFRNELFTALDKIDFGFGNSNDTE